MRILVFGDSITQGFWDPEGGWVTRLKKMYDMEYLSRPGSDFVNVFNLGISGATSQDLLLRMRNEIEARYLPGGSMMVIIEIGANDASISSTGDHLNTEEYGNTIAQITAVCKEFSDLIFFVGLTPVQDEKLNPAPFSGAGKISYSTSRMKLFDDALAQVCELNNVKYIPIWNDFARVPLDDVMHDGLHPNARGHEIIAGRVVDAIKEKAKT